MRWMAWMSPSSRRAWIEIGHASQCRRSAPVALLAEGVDRNTVINLSGHIILKSPSSRRAWIEMAKRQWPVCWLSVALLAEGVDRNCSKMITALCTPCRPPRGGRG